MPTDYYYGDVYFKMNDWIVTPPTCQIEFTCEKLSGPMTNEDLCNAPQISAFDPRYGDWYFFATNPSSWPDGSYELKITGTASGVSAEFILKFFLFDVCPYATWEILSFPFTDTVYKLGNAS